MKKNYVRPITIEYEVVERHGLMVEHSGTVNPDAGDAKENSFSWNDVEAEDLWGDDNEVE